MGTVSAGRIQISGKRAMLVSGFKSVWIWLLLTKLHQKGFRTVNNDLSLEDEDKEAWLLTRQMTYGPHADSATIIWWFFSWFFWLRDPGDQKSIINEKWFFGHLYRINQE